MSVTLKLIKKKEFTVGTDKHVHYTCGYKGRVIAVSTLNVEATNIEADEKLNTLKVNCDVDVVSRPWVDQITGETGVGLTLLPKLDITISQF